MLRSYDRGGSVTGRLLGVVLKKLRGVAGEINVLDLSDTMSLFLKYEYTENKCDVFL